MNSVIDLPVVEGRDITLISARHGRERSETHGFTLRLTLGNPRCWRIGVVSSGG